MKLATVCEIQSGYTARTGLTPSAGGVPAIQLRDLQGDAPFDPAGLPSYPLTGSFHRYWAGAGDVLFRSRGERNTAVMIAPDAERAAIAMMPLIVLRARRDLMEPGYLAWFINQPETQRYFDRCARGTRLRMIPKPCLDELDVPVPDLATQRLIVEVDALARHERELMQLLAEKRLEFTSFALLEQVRNAQPHGNGTGRTGAHRRARPSGESKRTNS